MEIAIYKSEGYDYLDSCRTERYSFSPIEADSHMYHSPATGEAIGIDSSFEDSELECIIIAPEGSKLVENNIYGEMLVMPDDPQMLQAYEALNYAKWRISGLSVKK